MKKLIQKNKRFLDAFDSGTLTQVANADSELKRHQEYATATFQKDARINIRISSLQEFLTGLNHSLPDVDLRQKHPVLH